MTDEILPDPRLVAPSAVLLADDYRRFWTERGLWLAFVRCSHQCGVGGKMDPESIRVCHEAMLGRHLSLIDEWKGFERVAATAGRGGRSRKIRVFDTPDPASDGVQVVYDNPHQFKTKAAKEAEAVRISTGSDNDGVPTDDDPSEAQEGGSEPDAASSRYRTVQPDERWDDDQKKVVKRTFTQMPGGPKVLVKTSKPKPPPEQPKEAPKVGGQAYLSVRWVAENLEKEKIKKEDAPSPDAWALMQWAKSGAQAASSFWSMYQKTLPTTKMIEAMERDNLATRRDGDVLAIIDRVLGAADTAAEEDEERHPRAYRGPQQPRPTQPSGEREEMTDDPFEGVMDDLNKI
jgi:hypothetical protein